jgi:hypothetical protein
MSLQRYNVSKWIKHQLLVDETEMTSLFDHLGSFFLYNVSELVSDPKISKEGFLKTYQAYIAALKRGEVIDVRRELSPALTTVEEAVAVREMKPNLFLAKPVLPVVQMQKHNFLPSSVDGKFYPMVLGQESISWGVQVAYPQIFQNPEDQSYVKVGADFSNTPFFAKLTRWIRDFSSPTTLIWNQIKTATPLRLGKKCYPWINTHPQLMAQGITVHVY